MKLSAPKKVVWIIAVILGVLGIVGHFVSVTILTANAFWLVGIAFILLALATYIKGL